MSLPRVIRDRRHQWLLVRARAGHEPSFRMLYRELYDPVAGYVARRIDSRDEAEDVVAEIFHRFLQRMDQFDAKRGSVWTWVMTATRYAVIDHHRAQRDSSSLDDFEDVLVADTVDPLTSIVREEEGRLLHGILRDEDPEVREIFALHFGEGLKYGEIAEILGLSENAIKQRFSRTMRRKHSDLSERLKALYGSENELADSLTSIEHRNELEHELVDRYRSQRASSQKGILSMTLHAHPIRWVTLGLALTLGVVACTTPTTSEIEMGQKLTFRVLQTSAEAGRDFLDQTKEIAD